MRYTEEQYVESASIQARIIDELNTELKALKKVNETQAEQLILHGVSTRFAIATETTDDIVKGRKYELIESETMGYYIIDESGEETYYHYSCLNVC